jgi:hypothetical protein
VGSGGLLCGGIVIAGGHRYVYSSLEMKMRKKLALLFFPFTTHRLSLRLCFVSPSFSISHFAPVL